MSTKDFENLAESLCSLDDLPVLPRVALLILKKIKKSETSLIPASEAIRVRILENIAARPVADRKTGAADRTDGTTLAGAGSGAVAPG
jgi:hypothetical protein